MDPTQYLSVQLELNGLHFPADRFIVAADGSNTGGLDGTQVMKLRVTSGQDNVTDRAKFTASASAPTDAGFQFQSESGQLTGSHQGVVRGNFQAEDGGSQFFSKDCWVFIAPEGFFDQLSGKEATSFRHLLIHAPDGYLYLLGYGQTSWPQQPFMSIADAGALFGGDPDLSQQFQLERYGVIQANLPGYFLDSNGRHHSFQLLHLSSMLSLLQVRGYEYNKLLLRGTDGRFYLVEGNNWPGVPVAQGDEPVLPPGIGDGSYIIRAEVLSKREPRPDQYFLLDLNGLLELIQPTPKNVVISKPEAANSSTSLRYYCVDPNSEQIPGLVEYTYNGDDPLGKPSPGEGTHFLATLVREQDGSGQPRSTFFFHLESFVASVGKWNPDNSGDQDVLLRVPSGGEASNSFHFYDFTWDNLCGSPNEADRTSRIDDRLQSFILKNGSTIGNITNLDVIWNFYSRLSQLSPEPGEKVEPRGDTDIISCYLLDLESLRNGS